MGIVRHCHSTVVINDKFGSWLISVSGLFYINLKEKQMTVLGWILMVFGSLWCLGRIQNQGDMYRSFLRVSSEKGVFFGIQRYITTEFILVLWYEKTSYHIIYSSIDI